MKHTIGMFSRFSISNPMRSFYLILVIVAVLGVSNAASQTSLPVSSGLQLWLRSDMGITLDGSGAVQTWADQSGNGHEFTQDTANARPALLVGGGPRGTNVLHFVGVDDVLRNPAQIVGGPSVTVFTVMAVREPGYPWVMGETYYCETTDGLPRRLFYEGHPGGGVTGPNFFDVADDCWNDERATFPGIDDTQFKLLTIAGTDRIQNVRVFVNGAPATMSPQGSNIEVRFSPGNTLGFVHTTRTITPSSTLPSSSFTTVNSPKTSERRSRPT